MANNTELIGDEAALVQLIEDDFTDTNGSFEDDAVTSLRTECFRYKDTLVRLCLPNLETFPGRAYTIAGCTALTKFIAPKAHIKESDTYTFHNDTALQLADYYGDNKIGGMNFSGCSSLVAVVLRRETMVGLSNVNAFNGTKYDTNGSGGAYVYVPRSLISSYQAATNWATLYNAHNDMFRALEDYTVDGTTTGAFDETKL